MGSYKSPSKSTNKQRKTKSSKKNSKDLKPIFEKWVNKILKLIQGQMGQVRQSGLNVKQIFLSGGFAESPYLQKKVKDFARLYRIQVKMTKKP
jgi:Tfp pilus assembly PilM family ATPase